MPHDRAGCPGSFFLPFSLVEAVLIFPVISGLSDAHGPHNIIIRRLISESKNRPIPVVRPMSPLAHVRLIDVTTFYFLSLGTAKKNTSTNNYETVL